MSPSDEEAKTSVDWDDWREIEHKDTVTPDPPEPEPPARWLAYYAAAIVAVVIVVRKL